MLFSSISLLFAASLSLAAPVPAWKREVPQEHSHEPIVRATDAALKLDNPDNIQDAIFGLLGAAAAANGAGNIADPDCLQQATADRAFTNAKAIGDIDGQVNALLYRGIERNTGQVGLKSVLCESIQAVNPEIAAITQHQDPASDGAAEINKAIVLELARQIAAIGGDPLDALKSGTFSPGQLGDPTAAGNTCNVADDAAGCIFSQNLLVLDASPDEIAAAVAGIAAVDNANANVNAGCQQTVTVTVNEVAAAVQTPAVNVVNQNQNQAQNQVQNENQNQNQAGAQGGNLQQFAGALGGPAPAVNNVGGDRPFVVENNADFLNLSAALGRSCDVQHNKCANAANSGADFETSECETQLADCRAQID